MSTLSLETTVSGKNKRKHAAPSPTRWSKLMKYHADKKIDSEKRFRSRIAELKGEVIGPFINSKSSIACVCEFNHRCKPAPTNILRGQGMCKMCARNDASASEETFRKLVSEMKGVVIGSYVNNFTPVECLCLNGHACYPHPQSVNVGNGICRHCRKSHGERKLEQLLTKLTVQFKAQYQITKDFRCYYDFGNDNTVIEFDGEQHFKDIKFFSRKQKFADRRETDIAKTELAVRHGRKIIRIHFAWLRLTETEQIQFLKSALAKNAPVIVNDLEAYSWLPMPIVLP
jgi:very-short-patch-repair endonuclease